ncbi:NIF-domain-containing protein [Punctularia strigosozonata HHB-11173 SS5]|uniref:NIF-domain-containing protein n=1 Tax=Punctularia strigosozonata (strain HHB-11173) TaxID=741275 RepID=UPI0004417AD9|nr:NIF-domain-containing protein [Punctularia strigosozonata HHB-11173 SS5]EIN10915.1 NIF-domain-containing protein [Punctularia strigosozonata HHB-11173 SS5]
MNSLSYLSRQFDHLASPRAPPSIPVLARTTAILDGDVHSIKRVKTWTKPFSIQPPPVAPRDVPPNSPKRSHSSPGAVFPPSMPKSVQASPLIKVKTTANENVLRRMFFVRVFVTLCNAVRGFWHSLTGARSGRRVDRAAEEGPEADGKDSEIEPKDELMFTPTPTTPVVSVQPAPAIPPHLPRLHSDPAALLDEKHVLTATEAPVAGSARKTPFHLPKTLVLDLDETLIHSTSKPLNQSLVSRSGILGWFGFGKKGKGTSHIVEVMLGGRRTVYHVHKRPFVDYFLRKVSTWYTLVIFTASMQEYADPVIDWLDAGRGILERRFFRESCTQHPNGSYMKDLTLVEQDLSRVCLIDNSPVCYTLNEANGIPIEGWTHDPSDEALLDLLPVLDSLRFTGDVRRVLGIRGFS